MYKPIPPKTLKRLVEKCGYGCVGQNDCAWIMESNGHPIVISQTMKLVPEDIIESMLGPADISENKFFQVLKEIEPSLAEPKEAAAAAPQSPPSITNPPR
jgi:hypothetical protein